MSARGRWARRRAAAAALLALAAGAGCRRDMQDQPRYEPGEASAFFADGRASRPLVPGTVARGQLDADGVVATGKAADGWARTLPVAVTRDLLARGRERYDIYCSPCHDRTGGGAGMIVQRGFKRPPSFHEERLRVVPVGYLFAVMTGGFGVMPSYAAPVPAADRWAIAAYLRALQLSQHVRAADLPAADRARLDAAAAAPAAGSGTGASHGAAAHGDAAPPVESGR
jgi:mono/diheme cytochrome c family protein